MKQTRVEDIKQGPNKTKYGPLIKRRRGEDSDKSSKTREEEAVVEGRRKRDQRLRKDGEIDK